ncbi:MAG: hypothetical protein M1382_03015 [Candidatus Marsarchaeota archaeon]|jgi:hypothetical protein|nr:hypothetical protein [Candidatus Marsarchaeota archaeon]
MGNPSPPKKRQGTIGELLTQIRFLQYEIEPSIPVIDSGNDIVALKGNEVRRIQVKTKRHSSKIWHLPNLREYDILVLIDLGEWENRLDDAKIYLLTKEQVQSRGSIDLRSVGKYELSVTLINTLFSHR